MTASGRAWTGTSRRSPRRSGAGIEAVALDRWEPYVQSVRTHVPEADGKLVVDRFHIMPHVGEAVNDVRKREHRERRTVGDELSGGTFASAGRGDTGSGGTSGRRIRAWPP